MTQAGKKSKSRKRHNSSWACTSLQPGPHTAFSLPRPRARGPARSGRSGLPRRARALDPAAASSGCTRCAARKEAAEWVPLAGTAPAGQGSQNPRPDRGATGGRAPAVRNPGPAGCPCLSGSGPGSSSPQPGAGRREVARAQAGAVATLTHGGDGGGGGSGPSVTSAAGAACRGPGRRGQQRAWLRAGDAGCPPGPRRLPRLRLRLRPRPGAVAWAG